MKKNLKSALAVLFTVCLLCASLLPVFAADPNVYKSEGIYLAGGEDPYPFTTTLTFDPASGRLTVDEAAGNIISIENTADLIRWIKTVADGVKTVYITKTSIISHFSNNDGLADYPLHQAFAYLSNLERFELEPGNTELTVKDGVLYTRDCLSLIHYPAAKPDKSYKIEESCMEGLEPFAFCNTKYLERLEFPSARSSLTYFDMEEYSLSAVDLETGEPREGSVKQIVFHGSEEAFWYINDFREGNNVAHQAEIVYDTPSTASSFLDFFRVTLPTYFRLLLKMLRSLF
ncbi:MAG: hypothetical protein IK104_10880 [Clostridia bacterium]|nr:hypothetical protein [Clostridia bacterium]